MKRSLLLVFILMFVLAACDDNAGGPSEEISQTGEIVWHQAYPRGNDGDFADNPLFMTVMPDDTILVTDSFEGIHVFDGANGEYQRTITFEDGRSFPSAIAIADDNTIWAAGFGTALYAFNLDGEIITEFTEEELGIPEESLGPSNLAIDGDGNIHLSGITQGENAEDLVVSTNVYTPEGELVRSYETGRGDEEPSNAPMPGTRILIGGPEGNAYYWDNFTGLGFIKVFDGDGAVVTNEAAEILINRRHAVAAVAVTDDGTIFVAGEDRTTDGSPRYEIIRINPEGNIIARYGEVNQDNTEFAPGEFDEPRSLALASNGDLIVMDRNRNFMQVARLQFVEQ